MTTHLELDPNTLDVRSLFNIMTGSIVPRPIGGLARSISMTAQSRAYSMFTAVCAAPPTVVFCPSYQPPDFREKDTYRNIAATGEFVITLLMRIP